MRRIRSTPLRLTVVIIAVFTGFLTVGLGTAYWLMTGTMEAEVALRASQMVDEVHGIREAHERVERVRDVANGSDPKAILLHMQMGTLSVGNPLPRDLSDGMVLSGRALHRLAPDLPGDLSESYLVRVADINPGHLVVLSGRGNMEDMHEIFLAILAFSIIPALLLTSGLGWLAARRAGARVGAIRQTLGRLASGALHTRVAGPHPDTDLGDISRDLNRMAMAQEAATEALRQIGSDIAHDLKTPIQRVSVRLERLDAANLPESLRPELEAARAETDQIIATFQSMLQIAQIEGGQGREGFGPVDLAALVTNLAEVYEPAMEEAATPLTLRIKEPLPVTGDRHLLGRLIANLLENAMAHAPGGPVLIALSGRSLRISDSGPGIPEARRKDVLRRLVRLESSRTTPGSGLGLALVKAVADMHDATLELGDAGPGLSVTLTFPAPRPGV